MKSLWMACFAMVAMTGSAAFAGGTAESAAQESAAGAEVAPVAEAAWIPSPSAITPAAGGCLRLRRPEPARGDRVLVGGLAGAAGSRG